MIANKRSSAAFPNSLRKRCTKSKKERVIKMKRTKRKKSLYWRVRSPFVAILLVVSMLAEVAITVQAVDVAVVCDCNRCVTEEIACEQCADCVPVAEERDNPEATTEEPEEDSITEEKEIAIGKEEPKKVEESKETEKTKETKEPKEDAVKEKEEIGKGTESNEGTKCPIPTRTESRGKHTIRYGYFTSRGRAAVDELIGRSKRGADFARNLAKTQLGIDQELTYVLSTDVSLSEGEVFPDEGITVAIPAPNVACGETVVVLHYIESQGVWEALSGTVENEVVYLHLMSFSPVVVYLAGTPWVDDKGMSEALSVIPEDAVKLTFTDNSPNGKTVLEHAFMSINEDGSISLFFLVSSNQKQLPLVMSYAGYAGKAIGQIGNTNNDNNVKKYVAYQVNIVLDGIRDISTGIVDISTGQGGHTINGGNPITFSNMTVQVQHYRMDVDEDGAPYRVTYETGSPGNVVTGSPINIYGYEYSPETSEKTASGTVPLNNTLVLKLYYQRDLEGSGVIVIEGPHVSVPYDGKEHSLAEAAEELYTITFPGEGYSLKQASIQATNPKGRNVGVYKGKITLGQELQVLYNDPLKDAETEGPEDVTNYVTIIVKPGSLTITPSNKEIVVTAGSATKAYDGEALTSDVYTYLTPPAGATHITAEVEGSQTEVGSSANRIVEGSVRIWNGTEDVTLFFSNIKTQDGVLTVTKDSETPITIWAESASKTYDGKALTESGFDHSNLPKGVTRVEATVVGSQTNAGKSSNIIEADGYKLFNEEGVEITELFTNVTLVPGTLEVLPRPAIVTANSGTKKAATEDPIDLLDVTTEAFNKDKGTGFIAGEEPTADDYLVAREPGEASGIYKVEFVKEFTTFVDGNYKVTWMPGKLVIEANLDEAHEDFFDVTIIANSHTSTYDGNEKVAEGIKEIINPNKDLEVITMNLAAKGVNVVDSTTYLPHNTNQIFVYEIYFKGLKLNPEDVVVHVEEGILEIQPATVTITALSDTIVLGQAIPPLRHMIDGMPVNGDALIHMVDYQVAHVDLKNAVGTYPIVVTVLEEANPNYIIEVVHGQLVIWIGERTDDPPVVPPPENPPPEVPNPPPENPNPPEIPTLPEIPTVPVPPETPITPVVPTTPTPMVDPPVTTTPEPTGPVVTPQIIETPAPLLPPPEVIGTPEINEDGTINYATIPNDEVPLAAPALPLHWALVNLLLTILTVIIMLLLMVTYFTNKRDKEEEDKEEDSERDREKVKRKGIFRLAAVVVAIISVVVFILTEDMRLPMVLIDRWTLLMAIIALIQVVVALISKKKYEEAEEVEEQMA